MRTSRLALAAMTVLATGMTARAEDGPDLFGPVQSPVIVANPVLSDTGSEAYPTVVGTERRVVTAGGVLPSNGGDGIVQSANSLPRGFEDGTPAYEYAQSVQRYWARKPTELAQAPVPTSRIVNAAR